jgi:BirA family biotin operon repressor/biotin-[acetyl-CoA-carboxylase] ligase
LNLFNSSPSSNFLPDDLAGPLQAASSRLGCLSGPITWYPEVASTNDTAMALAEQGAPEGSIVIADSQTSGRGRLGRRWYSPANCGLYTSVVLKPTKDALSLLTLSAGVALREGILVTTGLALVLKWPNDLFIGKRKLGGVLAEACSKNTESQYVILGFGINIQNTVYPQEIASNATSLEDELGYQVDKGLLLTECLVAISKQYELLKNGSSQVILENWRQAATSTFGSTVEWTEGESQHRGVVDGIDDSGALLVRSKAGSMRISSGQLRWL